MKRKIFIAINLPDQIKKKISKAVEEWRDLPMRWTKEEQYHLTLHFVGYVTDEKMVEICENIRELARKFEFFDLEFNSIKLAPNPENPRMLWLRADENKEFQLLRKGIEQELGVFKKSQKGSHPHVTLGRIKRIRWEKLPEKPIIKKEFYASIPAESIDVMASEFTKRGLEYFIIESCPLG